MGSLHSKWVATSAIPTGPTDTSDRSTLPDLDVLIPGLALPPGFDSGVEGHLPARLSGLIRLAGGKLTAEPPTAGLYAGVEWEFPSPGGATVKQKLTNRSRFTLRVDEGPIRFLLRRGDHEEWIEPLIDPNGLCDVDVEMRDTEKHRGPVVVTPVPDNTIPPLPPLGVDEPLVSDGNHAILNEFTILQSFFDGAPNVRPKTDLITELPGVTPIGGSDPFCPQGFRRRGP